MPTIFGILATSATALKAQQAGLSVTSHNIANANTEGYSRQRALISPNPALHTEHGSLGTGAALADVMQVRDALLDQSYRRETAFSAESQTRSDMMNRVEIIFGEPGEFALSGTLDRFLSAWSDLATNPGNMGVRAVVKQRGGEVVAKMHELVSNLDNVRTEVEARLDDGVYRINRLAQDISHLNNQIIAVEASGTTAGDLRDARAKALDELAGLIPVTVSERDDGSVGVAMSGYNIIDGAVYSELEVASSGGVFGLQLVGRPGLLADTGGSMGGLLGVLNTDLPAAVASLDDLAAALVADVNAIHATGTNPDGTTGIDFFDATGTTAWSMALSADVQASSRAVAAGTPDGTGAYRAGANDVALSIGALRDTALGALGATAGDHVRGLVSSIGMAVRSSSDAAQVHQTLADQADVRRMSLSGVSVDEELVQMIQFQTAYQAAARVVTAADEMLQSLLRI